MTAPQPGPVGDDLCWDRDRDGRMADHATGPDDEPATEPWQPDDRGAD